MDDFRLQSYANECPDGIEDEYNVYREWSPGITAWKIIGFVLERGWPIPPEMVSYLQQAAESIDNWAVLNGHPGELKDILKLYGKRKFKNDQNDPRWIHDYISQMKANDPKKSIKNLAQEYLKRHPELAYGEEAIRQKYYEGKKLAETGQDYKGRGRKSDVQSAHVVVRNYEDLDF